jgi:hypothetical protein
VSDEPDPRSLSSQSKASDWVEPPSRLQTAEARLDELGATKFGRIFRRRQFVSPMDANALWSRTLALADGWAATAVNASGRRDILPELE